MKKVLRRIYLIMILFSCSFYNLCYAVLNQLESSSTQQKNNIFFSTMMCGVIIILSISFAIALIKNKVNIFKKVVEITILYGGLVLFAGPGFYIFPAVFSLILLILKRIIGINHSFVKKLYIADIFFIINTLWLEKKFETINGEPNRFYLFLFIFANVVYFFKKN